MAAKWCLIIKTITLFTSLIWIVPGCEEVQLAGIVKPYWDRYIEIISIDFFDVLTCPYVCLLDSGTVGGIVSHS